MDKSMWLSFLPTLYTCI